MPDWLSHSDWRIAAVSLAVGVVVGLCGMGGGALLTPALLALGVPPTTAVTNDLVAAAATKSAGALLHWRAGHTVWPLVGWLTLGSVPGALLGARTLHSLPPALHPEAFVRAAIGWALVLAATLYFVRAFWTPPGEAPLVGSVAGEADSGVGAVRPTATVLVGLVGGFTVGLTSVGAGSIMMTALLLLHPRIQARRLVGTDLVQATPLVIAAGIGHLVSAPVDWTMVAALAIGGVPGALVGARLATRVPVQAVRFVVTVMLAITGLALAGPAALLLPALAGPLIVAQRRRTEAYR